MLYRFPSFSKKNTYCLLTLLVALNLLTACGAFSPNDDEVVHAITRNDTLNGHLYKIKNFRRVNGYKTRTGYVVEFHCELYILEDSVEYFRKLTQSANNPVGAIASLGLASEGIFKWGLFNAVFLTTCKKGDKISFSGSITMIKSEQGWIADPEE